MNIEEIIIERKSGLFMDEEQSAFIKGLLKDLIVLCPAEFTEACEEYEKFGWEVR